MAKQTLEKDRERYVQLCQAGRAQARGALEADLRQRYEEIGRLSQALRELIPVLQNQSGHWLEGLLEPEMLADLATAEFDALAREPCVRAVEFDKRTGALFVTAVAHGTPHQAQRGELASLCFRVELTSGEVAVESDDSASGRGEPAQLLRLARRAALAPAAAALAAAGDLAGLVRLCVSGAIGDASSDGPTRAQARARSAYVGWRVKQLRETRTEDGSLEEVEQQMARINRQMTRTLRWAVLLARALEDHAADDETSAGQYGRQYDLLWQLPGVTGVSVDRKAIRVHTDPVILRDEDGRQRLIGRFRIDILPAERVGLHNVDNRTGAPLGRYDHPHVINGNACWGNMEPFFARHLGRHSFPIIVQQAIEFLNSYNRGSCFAKVEKWPVYSPERPGSAEEAAGDERATADERA